MKETTVTGSLSGAGSGSGRDLRIVADDLSGATESLAAALASFPATHRPRGEVHLSASATREHPAGCWHALDLDTRTLSPAEANRRYGSLAQYVDAERSWVTAVKVDSLLRGNVAAAVGAVTPHAQRPVVLAAALPAQGRSIVAGRLQLPESSGPLGELEGAQPDVLTAAGVPADVVPLEVVRGGAPRLRARIDRLAAQGRVAAVDTVTEEDLDTVAAASLVSPAAVLVGASGLIGAIGRRLRDELLPHAAADPTAATCPGHESHHGVLVVAGSAEPQVQAQLDVLTAAGVPVEHQRCGEPAEAVLERMEQHLRGGAVALRTPSSDYQPEESAAILHRLAGLARDFLLRHPRAVAVLTGGATARAVLDELGVHTLELRCRSHAGAAHLQTATGREVITRPGSHGGATNLLELVQHLDPPPSNVPSESLPTAAFAQKEGM